MLVPPRHSALLRVLATEWVFAGPYTLRSGRPVTPRQDASLRQIEYGGATSEIAEVLSCCPLTIKDHGQATTRKRDSNTRTHAIVPAMSLAILPSD
jgi:DNA-binding CsgD family transcriptional regulator